MSGHDLRKLRDETVIPACIMLSVADGKRNLASRDAVRMLLAVTLQGANAEYRRQWGSNGKPLSGYVGAFGLWQIEVPTIGLLKRHEVVMRLPVFGVLLASSDANAIAQRMTVPSGDMLAALLARLLLLCDPQRLPTDEQEAWACYAYRTWKPSKPRPEKWAENWRLATEATEDMVA